MKDFKVQKNISFLILFLFLGCLQTNAQDTTYVRESIEKWKNSMDYTLEVAALMPDSLYDYKPTDEEMSFGQQLQHIAKNMCWLASSYLVPSGKFNEDDKFKLRLSPESIRILISDSYLFALDAIENVDLTQLHVTDKFFAGPKSKRQIINLMNDHATHHRGQIIVYLRLNGIKPPKYRGW